MKKIIALLLILIMAICVFPVSAFAEAESPFGLNTNVEDLPRMLWFKYSDGTEIGRAHV